MHTYFGLNPAGLQRGQCWAFAGHSAAIVFSIDPAVHVGCVELWHLRLADAPNADIRSAPRTFTLSQAVGSGPFAFIGEFRFAAVHVGMQAFRFSSEAGASRLRVQVTDNHGHPDHTCVYRFSVHADAHR